MTFVFSNYLNPIFSTLGTLQLVIVLCTEVNEEIFFFPCPFIVHLSTRFIQIGGGSDELVWLEPRLRLGAVLSLPDIDELCELPQKSTLLGPYWT